MRPRACRSAPAPWWVRVRYLRGSLLTSGIDARSQARCAGRTSQRQRATSPERSRGWPPWTQSENRSPTHTRTNGQRGPGPLGDQPDERTRPIDPARAEQTEMSQLRHDDLTTRLLACAEVLPALHRQEEHRDRAASRTTTTPLTALNTGNVQVRLPPARTAIRRGYPDRVGHSWAPYTTSSAVNPVAPSSAHRTILCARFTAASALTASRLSPRPWKSSNTSGPTECSALRNASQSDLAATSRRTRNTISASSTRQPKPTSAIPRRRPATSNEHGARSMTRNAAPARCCLSSRAVGWSTLAARRVKARGIASATLTTDRCPTLVLHARRGRRAPRDDARRLWLAATIRASAASCRGLSRSGRCRSRRSGRRMRG